ncbi:MAG: SMC-Scp complex subunit ScpB [Candidatus Vogelbacteria bacterium]|nr:SMC-Scp complex subunit ScpB [Candidatus Vogelbacteria bacterium]
MSLSALIEALLFWRAEPWSLKDLAKATDANLEAVNEALEVLHVSLAGRGLVLVRKEGEVQLATAPDASEKISQLAKEELTQELSKASLETLTIILYRGPISRSDIDYIRGVNSSFTLRHLMIRSLIERIANPNDARTFLYQTTFDTLNHLGVTKLAELPEYEATKNNLEPPASSS